MLANDLRTCDSGTFFSLVAFLCIQAFLMGKEWSAEVMTGAYKTLAEDLPLPLDAKGADSGARVVGVVGWCNTPTDASIGMDGCLRVRTLNRRSQEPSDGALIDLID